MKKCFILCLLNLCIILNLNASDLFGKRTVDIKSVENECVGTVSDPLCVVDTLVACVIRKDESLCKKIGISSKDFMDSMSALSSVDSKYSYKPVSMVVNKYDGSCSIHDGKTCVELPNKKLKSVDIVITTDTKLNIYMKRNKNGKISVVWAEEFLCFSDEECS